ncbi:MAG TPA: glycosyltransferase family 2 protein [Flavipsychrobacter sp.]
MQNTTPAITVLLPAYNAAEYIREAIDSVLNQTFTDFELLIINDGSTDNTENIIRQYSDARIRLHSQPNTGLVGALNKGLELAKGELIARFDADDVCYPERLQLQYDFMKANPDYILIGSEADYMEEDGSYIFTFKFNAYTDAEIRALNYTVCPFIHASVMFYKQDVTELGGYDKGAITFEDHLLWWKLIQRGKVKNMELPLIKVRFNPDSVTVDERWRGPEFKRIKYTSIQQGYVTVEDALKLKEVLASQNFKEFKNAAYYSMIGKKFLWNNYAPAKARKNLWKAIMATPAKPEPYVLYLLSFLPRKLIAQLYSYQKKQERN